MRGAGVHWEKTGQNPAPGTSDERPDAPTGKVFPYTFVGVFPTFLTEICF